MSRFSVLFCVALAACASAGTPEAGSGGHTTTRSVELRTSSDGRYRMEMVSPTSPPVSIAAPVEQVWALVPEAYAALELGGGVMDAEARIYGFPATNVRRRLAGGPLSRLLDCGSRAGLPNADSYTVNIAVRSQVSALGDGSQLRTQVEASAAPANGTGSPVRCGSTNELERRIQQQILQRIAGVR